MTRLMEALVDELGTDEPPERVKSRLEPDLKDGLERSNTGLYVAEAEGRCVGLCRADILEGDPLFRLRSDRRCGYIDQIYVRASHRGQGLGAELLKTCEDWLRGQGIGHVLLHAASLAAPFYSKRGYGMCRQMMKALGGPGQ